MFKKFKDKLAEEMKQSPARLQASVQQLAQAVVSPALSNSSIQEMSTTNDNFSLTEDGDETPKNTPAKHGFQNIDLMSPSQNRAEISRRSSVSSVTSDASSLFPMYESPPNLYHLQSDMDQSASEVDDNISPHLDKVTKDQLYLAYRKVQAKYQKYRGRYTDLATHYRELDRVKTRLESVLVETQDKVLRRVTDLKEQCQLEQQAKAHLEEALRNDIEEKDHIISTLNTKVKLLQANESIIENSVSTGIHQKENSRANLIDFTNEPSTDENSTVSTENIQLKDKLKKLEGLILRYKESLKRNKEKFTEAMKEKNTLENDYEMLKNSTTERISAMESESNVARVEIENLKEQVDNLHKREEESAISLAENKLSVHRELEEKEEQIKQLQIDLKHTTEDKENLNEVIARYKAELGKLQLLHANSNLDVATDWNIHDISKERIDAVRSIQQEEIKNHEEVDCSKEMSATSEKGETLENIVIRLKEKETELLESQHKLDELEKQNVEYRHDRETLQTELSSYKLRCSELKSEYDAQKIIMGDKKKDAEATIEKLQATVQSVDKELENMRNALIDRDQVCENYNKKVQQYAAMLEKTKHKLTEQETEIMSLKDRVNDKSELLKMKEELESKRTELNVVQNKFEACKSTIDDLKNKVQVDNSAISLLKKERGDLMNHLVYYKDCMQRLKQDCANIRNLLKQEFLNQDDNISSLNATLVASLIKFKEENLTLTSKVNESREKIKDLERSISEAAELRSQLTHIMNIKFTLETELKKSNDQLKMMISKSNQYDELNTTNNKLVAEIDNLNFKIYDLEKISCKFVESQQEIKVLQERLKVLENLESVNHILSIEIDNLKKDLAQANHTSEEIDELKTKLHEAVGVITLLKSNSSNHDALQKELLAFKSEIDHLKNNLLEKEKEIKIRDEKIVNEEEHIAYLKSTCDSHIQTIEEHVRKYLNLEGEYQTTRENHAKQTAELMENNKVLQETINVKLVQLKKMKIIKERQSKTIEEMNVELNELKTKHVELSNMLESSEKQIKSLISENSQVTTIALENKDLKDKHNDLLNSNQRLCENEAILKQKIQSYEKDIEVSQKDIKSYKLQINSQNDEIERLNSQLITFDTLLDSKNAELNSFIERLMISENELQIYRDNELQTKVSELNVIITNANIIKEENERLLEELKLLRDEVKRIKGIENENIELKSELNNLIQKNSDVEAMRLQNNELIIEQIALKNKIAELETVNPDDIKLETHVNNLQSKISNLESLRIENERLLSEIETLQSAKNISTELNVLKNSLAEKDAEIKLLEDRNSNMSQQIANLKHFSLEIDEKTKKADMLRSSVMVLEEKISSLQSEINSLVQTNDSLRNELEIVRNDRNTECQSVGKKLQTENKRLEAQLDEILITFQAKETQMQIMNNELREQTDQLREQLKTNEEEQGMRLKQLVKEFQAQLHDKEEELQAALEKRFDRQHNYESNLVQQYKEQLKDFQIELTEKSEQIESLALERKDAITEKGKDIDRLIEQITQIKKEHANEIKEVERKWKAIVQQRIDNLQTKHEEEVNELTKEWQNERKLGIQTEAASEELESTSRVAMAAIQTNTGSIHTLQQTLTSQRRELAELRKLVKLRHDTLEDSTEIEYLRNILFEYMMGKETVVLARVIAAVVKFDQEQTAKILKKEEDKMTLFGSLGLT